MKIKKLLLATVAAAALIAGHGFASAEGAPKQEGPAQRTESPAPAPSAQQNAPAEKMAPANKAAQDKGPDSKPMTTGQGQSGSQMSQDQKAQDQKSAPAQRSSSEQRGTSGQGAQQKASETAKPDASKNAADSKSDATKSGNSAQSTTNAKPQTTGSAPSGGSVTLTTEQKTKVRSTVLTSSAPRVTNINFSINVGTVVPRTVKIVAVPTTLVEIHPAWRGYMYFVYNDEIIIVEPGTMRIVEVLVV